MILSKEQVMVANGMKERGTSLRQLARFLAASKAARRLLIRSPALNRRRDAFDGRDAGLHPVLPGLSP